MTDERGLVEIIGAVELGRHVFDSENFRSVQLAHFEEASIDVARSMTGLAVARQLDGARIVDA